MCGRSFAEEPGYDPVKMEIHQYPGALARVPSARRQPVQRCAEVCVLEPEPDEMFFAVLALGEIWGLGGQVTKEESMRLAGPLLFAAGGKAFQAEVPDRFEHRVSRLGILSVKPEHAIIYKGG